MELRTRGPGHAMPGPGGHEIRVVGEVAARVDVMVPGRHDVRVWRVLRIPRNLCRDTGPAGHLQASPFAEVVLHVDDDEGGPLADAVRSGHEVLLGRSGQA
jgi:hypothetical protein